MGSFSVFNWVFVGVIVAAIYFTYRLAQRPPLPHSSLENPAGVGGWLLLLVYGLLFLGPLAGVGRLSVEFSLMESNYPALAGLNSWNSYKYALWGSMLAVSGLSIYAGLGLANGRDVSVVKRAQILLWVIWPVATLVMGKLVPLAVFGHTESDPTFNFSLFLSVTGAAMWTAYLSLSRRVKATYAPVAVESRA